MVKTSSFMKKEDRTVEELLDLCEEPQADVDAIVRKTMHRIHARSRWRRAALSVASALSAAAIAAVCIFFAFNDSSRKPGLPTGKDITFEVPAGAYASLHLPDGSLVRLNSASEITYPERFCGKERKVYIKGEAYFDVTHDAGHPFIVSTDYFDVKVHGTKFNVNTYGPEPASTVLVEGAVELSVRSSGNGVMLSPGQKGTVTDGLISVSDVCTDDYICWTKGYVILNGTTIEEIAKILSTHYGIPVDCGKVSGQLLFGKLEFKDRLEDVLYNLGKMLPVKISYIGDRYLISE